MFCNYCKSARPENAAPCPNCGAPSSLLGQPQAGGWGTAAPVSTTWGEPVASSNNPWNNQVPQIAFGSPANQQPSWQQDTNFQANQQPSWQQDTNFQANQQPSWQQDTNFQGQPMPQQQAWGAYGMPQLQEQPGAQQSLLPVPYQGNPQAGYQQNQMQLVPMPNGNQMLPAIPDEMGAQQSIYVEPMYTKPRPIIPTYRIISGFLSVMIMAALLCGGSVYYAKATGKLTGFQRLIGSAPPPSIAPPAAAQIQDPTRHVDTGPALNIITAAATTAHVDPRNLTPQQSDQIFQVGVPFYVTYSARPPKPGHIIIKWYMNNQHYTDTVSDKAIDPKVQPSISGDAKMVYSVPAEGKVELYWSDQPGKEILAQTLYFAVR